MGYMVLGEKQLLRAPEPRESPCGYKCLFLMLSSLLSFYPKNVYTVSFPKPGFVELSPVPIDVGTEINLSFSTKNESGIILLGSGGTPAPPRRKRRQTGQVPSHLANNAFSLMLI